MVKNSEASKNIIKNTTVKRGYCMASFDVKPLFTKIPIQHTLAVMKSKLQKDDSLKDKTKLGLQDVVMLIETCMDDNFFEFKSQFYEQTEGATLGSPISPCFAKFMMQDGRKNYSYYAFCSGLCEIRR